MSNCCRNITSSSEEDQTEDAFLKVRRAQPEKWKLWVLFYYPPKKNRQIATDISSKLTRSDTKMQRINFQGSTKQPEKWILGSHMWIIVLLLPTRNLKPFKTYLLNAFRLDKKRKECTFAYEVIWYLVFTDQTAFTITSYNAKNIFLPKNMNANFELK